MTATDYVTYRIKGTTIPSALVTFNGPFIFADDLKVAIMAQRKMSASRDVELVIQNEQSGKEYQGGDQVARHTQVIISRRVIGAMEPLKPEDAVAPKLLVPPDPDSVDNDCIISKIELGAGKKRKTPSPEIVPVKFRKAEPASNEKGRSTEQLLNLKRAIGIPRSDLIVLDGPCYKGAVLTNGGHYAVRKVDAKAYNDEAKKISQANGTSADPIVISDSPSPPPMQLICPICNELLRDAAATPCCGSTYCDECIRDELLNSDDQLCPTCNKPCLPDSIIPKAEMRSAVSDFINGEQVSILPQKMDETLIVFNNNEKPIEVMPSLSTAEATIIKQEQQQDSSNVYMTAESASPGLLASDNGQLQMYANYCTAIQYEQLVQQQALHTYFLQQFSQGQLNKPEANRRSPSKSRRHFKK